MEKRRETRQLRKQDVIELSLSIKAEVSRDAEVSDDGQRAVIHIKAVPCGPDCGRGCTCHYSVFESIAVPAAVTLKATQRVSFLGNLAELRAEREAMEQRIAMIEASYGNGEQPKHASGSAAADTAGGDA
jgi:hypothetical protein